MFSFGKCLKQFLTNYYLFVGIILGIFINLSITDFDCTNKYQNEGVASDFNYSSIKAVWRTNVTRKVTKKPSQLIRPRYYSTELGIREKLFVGVITTEEQIHLKATHLNKTIEHLVDKVKFFITAERKTKTKLNYTGIVGFTDTRYKYRPFQIIKYISDNFLQDFDYYFLMNDFNYLNARRLVEIVGKLSVSMNVYLGNVINDGSYCNLDSGILISNSVLKAMKEHLEWCVMNAVTDDHSENVGRCIYHSTKLECQDIVQGQHLPTYKLKNFELTKHFTKLTKQNEFNEAVTVYPILQKDDYYLLHAYYSKLKLVDIKKKIKKISKDLNEHWPPGERKGSTPATRFDLPSKKYFNMTHMFAADDFSVVQTHNAADLQDIHNVLEYVKAYVARKHPNKYEFKRLINGYRKFDLSRGLDYEIDLLFNQDGRDVIKRFEVCKPLGNAEFIPAPYVTENTRITILLPIEEHEISQAEQFLEFYAQNIMERHDKTHLMLIFLYQYNTSSKGHDDIYVDLKQLALKLTAKYQNDDMKVAWVSIRLPQFEQAITLIDYPILNYVIIDLALRKIGVESLTLLLNVNCDIQQDFLNRVRMNTVLNFQIFSPIPYRFYNQQIANYEKIEINKNAGHFDREEWNFISFYGRDYVEARKRCKHLIPLTRSDNDIQYVINDKYKHTTTIFEMFHQFLNDVHCLRAPDISLKVRYHEEMDLNRTNWFLGTKSQIAKLILSKNEL